MMSKDAILQEKQELIKQCRYYKGEAECPPRLVEDGYGQIWKCEQDWVTFSLNGDFENGTFVAPFGYKEIWQDDIKMPIIDDHATPIDLLRMLFANYCYYAAVIHPGEGVVSSYSDEDGWTRMSALDGFERFLKRRYYSDVTKSQSSIM